MASAIGVARMPTQGSWRPKVSTVAAWPALSIDSRGVRMLEVGLIASEAVMSLAGRDAAQHAARVIAAESGSGQFVAVLAAALRDAVEAGADLHTLTALMPISA